MTKNQIVELMGQLSKIDYGEALPPIDDLFLRVWADHYLKIVSCLTGREAGKSLEVGIGYGVLGIALSRWFNMSVVATEHPSRGYLKSPEYRRLVSDERIPLVCHDLKDPLPFRNDLFDNVFMCDVLEHVQPHIMLQSLNEGHRVLKNGGLLFITMPNLARFPNRIRFLLGGAINPPVEPRRVGETFDHVREYTPQEILHLVRGRYEVVGCEYGLIPYFNEKYNRISKALFLVHGGFGDEMYIVARKVGGR